MKQKPILAAITLIAFFSLIFFPGHLYAFVELLSFSTPGNPQTGLVLGTDGNFYGTTSGDGASGHGTVFKMTSDGVLATLISFNGTNGGNPIGNLIQGSNGNFYGTTSSGGINGNGTIFKMTLSGVLTTLVSFNGTNGSPTGGGGPLSPPSAMLIQGSDGSFYGTTGFGGEYGSDSLGTYGYGTVFRVTPEGALTALVSFNGSNGSQPNGLVQGTDGNFYGTTQEGGAGTTGTVFQMTPQGVLVTLFSFDGEKGTNRTGAVPLGGLAQGTDGNFYGTTAYSGYSLDGGSGPGTVFKVTPSGALTTIASLADGYYPKATLLVGGDGNFYGSTFTGGASGNGTIFQMTQQGVLTTLTSFYGANGANPQSGLVQGNDGNFYGVTTYSGGPKGDATPWDYFVSWSMPPPGAASFATIFKITPAGVMTTLVSFINTNGYDPNAGLVQGSDGNFYGTTAAGGVNNCGTVFRITPSGILTTLASFNGANGSVPTAPLIQGIDGNFYGTTYGETRDSWGDNFGYGNGTVFKITPAGVLTTLYSFTNGVDDSSPHAPLVQGNDGNFYGTTSGGWMNGNGTVFQITPGGALTTLTSSLPGGAPYAGLVQGTDGNFYGTSELGGGEFCGTAFKMTDTGLVTPLVLLSNFIAPQEAGLLQASDGNFYGTTPRGGASFFGSVFKMTSDGALTTLYSFTGGNNGSQPYAALLQGRDGNFYGTTFYDIGITGPGYIGGTVYKITPAGVLTTLVSFNGPNGNGPQGGLIQGRDGNFYGTTDSGGSLGGGNVFRINSVTNPPPPMTATMAGNQIIVSWPEDYPAFTLQTATRLNPPVNWLDATDSPVLLNGQFTVTNSLSSTMFYRLRY